MSPKKTLLIGSIVLTSAITQIAPSQTTRVGMVDNSKNYRTGDIISHTSKTNQSKLIKAITGSNYTHIGMVVKKNNSTYVLEAVQPVKYTPVEEWIDRGIDDKYTVMRYPNLNDSGISKVVNEAEKFLNKDYDPFFHPSDSKIYCSELVQKSYERGSGISLGEWESFNKITGEKQNIPAFKKEMKRRWGKSPGKTLMVTPESIMKSNELEVVYTNY